MAMVEKWTIGGIVHVDNNLVTDLVRAVLSSWEC